MKGTHLTALSSTLTLHHPKLCVQVDSHVLDVAEAATKRTWNQALSLTLGSLSNKSLDTYQKKTGRPRYE
jgi:hypothetical protein